MQLQIENQQPIWYTNQTEIEPLNFTGDVVLAVDQSKRNTAMIIATPYREILKVIQFGSPGKVNKTSTFCDEFEGFVSNYLQRAHVVDVFIEQPTGDTHGMHFYQSAMSLMEIRARWVALSKRYWSIETHEVNNWAWKRAILPEGYRSQNEKGSARYFFTWYAKYGSDDVTDALGILLYGLNTWYLHVKLLPTASVPSTQYSWYIRGSPSDILAEYNQDLSWDDNLSWLATNVYGISSFIYPRSLLSKEDIESRSFADVSKDALAFFVWVVPAR